jgi:hypothetical protein
MIRPHQCNILTILQSATGGANGVTCGPTSLWSLQVYMCLARLAFGAMWLWSSPGRSFGWLADCRIICARIVRLAHHFVLRVGSAHTDNVMILRVRAVKRV